MPASRTNHATFRFYGELNDFLPPSRRQVAFRHDFQHPSGVKDIFEGIGVPHPEVGLILLNGDPVDFANVVRSGDRISIYPELSALQIIGVPRLRPELREHRFVADAHLGKLARYLRLLGFDTLYQSDCDDKVLARASHEEQRILLTRDLGLLKRSEVVYGYFVRSTQPGQQTREVVRRFDLFAAAAPFRRCIRCNAELNDVAKKTVIRRLPVKTRAHYDRFRVCPGCDRVYWEGSHYDRLSNFVQETLAKQRSS